MKLSEHAVARVPISKIARYLGGTTTFGPLGLELRHILGGPHGASPRPPQPREQQDGGRTQNDHGEEDEEIAGAHDRA